MEPRSGCMMWGAMKPGDDLAMSASSAPSVDEISSKIGEAQIHHMSQGTMESLSEDVLVHIFQRLEGTDRNNAAAVCRRWFQIDRVLRTELAVGCGLSPPEAALRALTRRFVNLTKLQISYPGWLSDMGRQVDDSSLEILSQQCPSLSDLTLNFCGFITDAGMGNLTLCKHLTRIRLNFLPCVTGRGLLSLVSGCTDLSLFHVERMMGVRTVEWLEFLGRKGNIENLAIKKCKCVGDHELRLLGSRGWENLREFAFEIDLIHSLAGNVFGHNGREASVQFAWRMQAEGSCCPNLRSLSLTKCLSASGTGLNWLLTQCPSLNELRLDTCIGLENRDLLSIPDLCPQLSSLVLRPALRTPVPRIPQLTDAGLIALAHCNHLETFELSFCEADRHTHFSSSGIAAMIENCRGLKHVTFSRAPPVTDQVILSLCTSNSVESVQLIDCHEVTDMSLRYLVGSSLKELRIQNCNRLSDSGFLPFKFVKRLDYLKVSECPELSKEGLEGVAKVVIYNEIAQQLTDSLPID